MKTQYEVLSYHLNIGEGDSAVYSVTKDGNLVNTVLIDGGRHSGGDDTLHQFMASPEARDRKIARFDTVVITHWDDDHSSGVLAFILKDLKRQLSLYKAKNKAILDTLSKTELKAKLQDAANNGDIRSSLLQYDNPLAPCVTVSTIYAPYRLASQSKVLRQLGIENQSRAPHGEVKNYNYFILENEKTPGPRYGKFKLAIFPDDCVDDTIYFIWIKAFLIGPMGRDLLGVDLFKGKRVLDNLSEVDSPKVVSNHIAKYSLIWKKPVLYCIGCDGFTLCPDKRRYSDKGDKYDWTDTKNPPNISLKKMDLTNVVLRKGAGQGRVSAKCIDGPTTGNNLSSIACMIIWPSATDAVVSHYVGGDVGDENEELFLRWATVEDPQDASVRRPIKVRAMKLSHHGSKFSSPALMFFAWKPDRIVVSNSQNLKWNHPSWETLLLIWVYARLRCNFKYRGDMSDDDKILLATIYPPYLCKFLDFQKGKVVSMKVGSLDSLTLSSGANFRAIVDNVFREGLFRNWLNKIRDMADDGEKAEALAKRISDYWTEFSLIYRYEYTGRSQYDTSQPAASAPQKIRAIRLLHKDDNPVVYHIFLGDWMCDIEQTSTNSLAHNRGNDNHSTHTALRTTRGSRPLPLPKKLGRDETMGDSVHQNRSRRIPLPDKIVGRRTFEIFQKDAMNQMEEKKGAKLSTTASPSVPQRLQSEFLPPCIEVGLPLEQLDAPSLDGLYFIKASDADAISSVSSSTYRVKDGHLDWFLGDLDTGALVLASKPHTKSQPNSQVPMTPLHKTDETNEWLMHCMGNANDDKCAVNVTVITLPTEGPQQLVNITGFELQTQFKYLCGAPADAPPTPFFQEPVIFSAKHNIHDFDVKGNVWPNIAAADNTSGTDTIVGPAHIVCLSLGKTPSIVGKTVKMSDVLLMFQIQATGWLDNLIKTSSFNLTLDTTKGQKNAMWYTPAEHHDTTLRLCFKQAPVEPGEKTIFETVCNLIQQFTGFELKLSQMITTKPRLIVKKTWTLISETQVETFHEVTILLQVAITSPSLNTTMQFDTALIFASDGTIKWVINFSQGGDFKTLIKFIASIFSANLPDTLDGYLPGCNQISIRRVIFTNTPSTEGTGTSRSLEVILQIVFADMILQCSLQVDFSADGKTKFGLFGKLFPESRAARLGEPFFWVPYTSGYEQWTALEIAPVKNTVHGILEDAPATEVGDLRKTFNALRKKDKDGDHGQKELVASPTNLELVGLQFGLTGEEVTFNATVISDIPKGQKIPAIKLWAANLDLRYDVNKKTVSNCSFTTSMMMTSPDKTIPPAKWNLELDYNGEAALWTLSGGVGGLRGDLLYSLFDEDSNSEMAQLLSHMTLSLQLTYKYTSQAKASDFKVEGNLWLGHLRFGAKYCYPPNGQWTFEASLNPEFEDHGEQSKGQSLLGVLESICGPNVMSILPDMVRDILVKPTENWDLTSLRIVRLEKAILMLVRLQITDTTSIAFYQYQPRRTGKEEKAPAAKRALVFSLDQLPQIPDVPMIGTMHQPFDEARFLWVGGGDTQGWTKKEIEELNKNAQGYPQITFRDTGKESPGGDAAAYDKKADNTVVLKSGFHLCLVEGGETRLDYAFGGKPEKDPKKNSFEASLDDDDTELVTPMANTAKVNKTIGPVTILGVGIDFDITEKKLKLIVDGTVKLGPIDLTLLGFSLTFDLKGKSLTNLSTIDVTKDIKVDLEGLAIGFQKDPISIAGMFEHRTTDDVDLYLGGAVVGFKEWKLEAGGFYGTAKKSKVLEAPKVLSNVRVLDKEDFKAFLAYVRVSGPIATIGYAEIRGLVGGFGYNTSIKMPTIDTVQSFPFLAQNNSSSAAGALTNMLDGGWFDTKEGENWVAAGLTIQAFEMLKITAVVAVEWGSSVRLGIFGLATAEIPKQVKKKFAVVQLGVVAMVDFNAGVMKVDGQLTPASYILDESCHLTGGFALYTWFGPGTQQGDWVFTIGGYHPQYQKPDPYPNPPRLGISWSYDSHINITGGAYFAVTPKTCMGGGSLHIALTLGPLYAYLDAWADFLINYRPFLYRASAGVMVGVNYTLDLWLVTIPIKVDLSAIIWLQGPPLSGTVHVDFFVFGFDVKFGPQNMPGNDKISLRDFYQLVIQTTDKGAAQAIGKGADIQPADQNAEPALPLAPTSQLINCISGLIPKSSADQNQGPPEAGEKWRVRGAIFAFTVSCKFAVQTAKIYTQSIHQDGTISKDHTVPVNNTAKGVISSKPMHLSKPFEQSSLHISITAPAPPAHPSGIAELQAANPIWEKHELGYSNLPTALYGRYDGKTDPSAPGSDPSSVLNGSDATTNLLTSITLYAPPSFKSEKDIAAFDVALAMGQRANNEQPPTDFPPLEKPHGNWMPDKDRDTDVDKQMAKVKKTWEESGKEGKVARAAEFMAGLGLGGWEWEEAKKGEVKVPEKMVEEMGVWWIEAPGVCEGGVMRGCGQ